MLLIVIKYKLLNIKLDEARVSLKVLGVQTFQ